MNRVAIVLGLLVGVASPAASKDKLELRYTLELERNGERTVTNALHGFRGGDRLRLRVEPKQASYVYLMVSRNSARFRLVFPEPEARRWDNLLPKNKWVTLPEGSWLRLDENPGVERLYLVVANERIAELEKSFIDERVRVSESVVLDVRDRYQGEGRYCRELKGNTVKVKYETREKRPAVLVEEIQLRHR